MAGGKGAYLAGVLLDHVLGATVYTAPATVYVALFTSLPVLGVGGTEVTGGSYARVAKTNNATNWPAQSSQIKRNGTVITFPQATADWGTVVGCGVYDASSGGNLLYWGPLGTNRAVFNGDTFEVPINGGTFTEA